MGEVEDANSSSFILAAALGTTGWMVAGSWLLPRLGEAGHSGQYQYPSVKEFRKTDLAPDYLEGLCVSPSSRTSVTASHDSEL